MTRKSVSGALVGGCIFLYSDSNRKTCFEIRLILEEAGQADPA